MSSIHADPPPPIVTEPDGIQYATGPALGKGGFAICHRAERYNGSSPTGQLVALKIVKTKMEPAKLAQKFVTELQIHSKVLHPNIVTFYRAFSFQTSTYVVLELCSNGSLADMLKKRRYLTLPEIRRFVIQICGAVKYLHHRHVVHRDLKTGNLFLDGDMNIKVGDFGLAALLVTEKDMEAKRRTTMCGTPNYLAPEILEKGKGHDEKVDLWAIGVIAYTLAVGKAPFHATTKDEIYKKLKSGTYTWPELSATTNQSSDLRNLVASLLVPEEQRPVPDQIVSQNFFKIAYVPASIPAGAREKTPKWPDVALPSPESIRRGYTDTWYAVCRESGVGEYVEGQCFKLPGGKARSIINDFLAEEQMGGQPTMPLPKGLVYRGRALPMEAPEREVCQRFEVPHVNDSRPLTGHQVPETSAAARLPPVAEDRPSSSQRLKEISDNIRMPPPARPNRTATVRKAARTISEEAARAENGLRVASDEAGPSMSVRLPKVRQTAAPPVVPSSANATMEKPARTRTVKRSADASLARRPRQTKPKERPRSPEDPGPLATLDELKQVSPLRKPRHKAADAEVVEILSDPEPEAEPEPAPAPAASFNPADAILSLPPPPRMTANRLPVPRKTSSSSTNSDPDTVTGTDPNAVLERLNTFRSNVSAALSNTTNTRTSSADAASLPFITRWVDYSRKHGVGYVLSDGTVGCIINAASRNGSSAPVTHVVVRNGQKWLAKVGKNSERIDAVPLEILEDCGKRGIKRKVYKELGSVKEGPLMQEAERRRTLQVLWVKFGRYMCQTLGGEEAEGSAKSDSFVRFYQRVGSVGMWVFADGCIQAHFPDHTKLVLSPTGTDISATCISPEAVSYLSTNGDLLPHHVSSREVLADSLSALLNEGGRVRARIVKANAIKEKLEFLQVVVGQWVEGGGFGRGDVDGVRWKGVGGGEAKQGQAGVVTVGRYGGDVALV
ncbi:Cell cycle serine/threonine-protein kinase cdc5/MSD2 [Saxophila tyrrhenica]|uniref:Cell cycle serine/threonine-protein kinase cdc5/MSD2 n=1 Tax=Saxophila tyrrhenica TaxID=1690608 RepID=A0AAV9PIB8_9PEZI|nr:Cell cycle serine/threonine-protein kinase cdc5/MSD2 [Saxophila tyrrhenica]